MTLRYFPSEPIKYSLNRPKGRFDAAAEIFALHLIPTSGIFVERPKYFLVTADGREIEGSPHNTRNIAKRYKGKNFSDTALYSFRKPADIVHLDDAKIIARDDKKSIEIGTITKWPNQELKNIEAEILASKSDGVPLPRAHFRAFSIRLAQFTTAQRATREFKRVNLYLSAAARIRPNKLRNQISIVLAEYRSAGLESEARKIEEKFRQLISPYTLLPHGGYTTTLQLKEIPFEIISQRINELAAFWSNHGYEMFINSGTLLGIVREGKFLEHDDDVDLGIVLHGATTDEVIADWGRVHDIAAANQMLDPRRPKNKYSSVYKFLGPENLQIDLFPAWENPEGQFSVYPHSFNTLSPSDILPIQRSVAGQMPIPNNPEIMLASNYGKDWAKPDAYYMFPWRRANFKFRYFLQATREKAKSENIEIDAEAYGDE